MACQSFRQSAKIGKIKKQRKSVTPRVLTPSTPINLPFPVIIVLNRHPYLINGAETRFVEGESISKMGSILLENKLESTGQWLRVEMVE